VTAALPPTSVDALRSEVTRLAALLGTYVGVKPTVAEEMAYVRSENDRLRAERDQARRFAVTFEQELAELRSVVDAFCAERAGVITAILNCHPDNQHDYDRWQGHAESRRQLSQRLGLPVGWPVERNPAKDGAE